MNRKIQSENIYEEEQPITRKPLADPYLYDEDIIEAFSNKKKSLFTPIAIFVSIAVLIFSSIVLFKLFTPASNTPVISAQENYFENVKPQNPHSENEQQISLTDKLISDQEIKIQKIKPEDLEIREIPLLQNEASKTIIPQQQKTKINTIEELPEAIEPDEKYQKIAKKLLSKNEKTNIKNLIPKTLRENQKQISNITQEQIKTLLKLREINKQQEEKKIAKITKNINVPEQKHRNINKNNKNLFYVQLAAHRTVQEASTALNRLRRAGGGFLQKFQYQIVAKNIPNKGVFHTLRIGNFKTRNEASILCEQIKIKKISDCFVPNQKS